jgi:hypothetical protein
MARGWEEEEKQSKDYRGEGTQVLNEEENQVVDGVINCPSIE